MRTVSLTANIHLNSDMHLPGKHYQRNLNDKVVVFVGVTSLLSGAITSGCGVYLQDAIPSQAESAKGTYESSRMDAP